MRSHLARRTIARRALVLAGAAVLTVPFATSSAFAATSSRATLAGSTPSWATSGRMVGSPSASTKISFNVVLPLRNSATADKLAADVSNPKSASYGHYLTAAQFNATIRPDHGPGQQGRRLPPRRGHQRRPERLRATGGSRPAVRSARSTPRSPRPCTTTATRVTSCTRRASRCPCRRRSPASSRASSV